MNVLLGHCYAGQRMGANNVIRRSLPDGWYLMTPRADLIGGVPAEFSWGAESDAATLTAATILYDAFGVMELARAAARAFAAQMIAKLPPSEWTLSLAQIIAWLCVWLSRQAEGGVATSEWPAPSVNGKAGR